MASVPPTSSVVVTDLSTVDTLMVKRLSGLFFIEHGGDRPGRLPHGSGGFRQAGDMGRLRLAQSLLGMVSPLGALTRAQPPPAACQEPAPSAALVYTLFVVVVVGGEVLFIAAFSSSANAADVASTSCQGSSTISGHTAKPKSM